MPRISQASKLYVGSSLANKAYVGTTLVWPSDVVAPTVVSFSPLDNATGVSLLTNLVVTFSETIVLGTGNVTIKKTSDNSTIEAWNVATEAGSAAGKVEVIGSTALTMHLTTFLSVGVEYYVIWDAGVVKDIVGNNVAAQSSTTAWSFTTVAFLDLDLTNPATAAYLTCVRASDGWADNLAGVWTKFASNVPRITDKGMLVEVARSNYCRWSRDLTNAQWGKTNITVAKDQTGVDGVANSASSITATADLAIINNTCSIASGARIASMFVKRLVGTGTVELSVNGVANAVPVTVTSSWTRVVSSVITIGNPTFAIRLGTSGDSIAVDFCQTEVNFGGAPSSPIETTSAATTTRQQDTVTATPSSVGIPGGPMLAIFAQGTPLVPITYGVAQILINWDDTTTSNQVILRRNVTTGAASAFNIIGGTNSGLIGTAIGTVWADGVRGKAALSIATGSQAATKDGGAGTTGSSASAQVPLSVLRLGNNPANNVSWNGWIEWVTVYPTSKTLAELQTMTT